MTVAAVTENDRCPRPATHNPRPRPMLHIKAFTESCASIHSKFSSNLSIVILIFLIVIYLPSRRSLALPPSLVCHSLLWCATESGFDDGRGELPPGWPNCSPWLKETASGDMENEEMKGSAVEGIAEHIESTLQLNEVTETSQANISLASIDRKTSIDEEVQLLVGQIDSHSWFRQPVSFVWIWSSMITIWSSSVIDAMSLFINIAMAFLRFLKALGNHIIHILINFL